MPSAYDQKKSEPLKKGNTVKTAFDSESFDADWTIHVQGLVGSATISPSGRDVALASPEGLAIIDLDSPYSPPRRLSSRGLPWLVVDVQWSPFAARDYWVASTANHRCLVWNLNFRDDSASGPIEHSLQGHSRAITDINFSAHHPDLLATCSVDGYVHNWDLRRPQRPALSFCDWTAGATQVKYSRQDPHILASSHDRLLHIWDERRPAEPVKTIMAHSSKIYGIDWNRTRSSALVTCSLDKSIKFWDYKNDGDAPERVIRTDFPVWRARHTPFGWGVLAMPQNEPGNLHLFDGRCEDGAPLDSRDDPLFVFKGHGGHKVKEFLWRSRGGVDDNGIDSRDFQLVSWGADKELRLERMEADVLGTVGYVKGQPAPKDLVLTRKGATYKTFRTVDDNAHRDRWNGTMTDPRAGHSSNPVRGSGLTSGFQTPYQKSASAWRAPSMKAKTMAKESNRSLAQIGWMRGITMSKRKPQPATTGLNRDTLSPTDQDSMLGSVYHDSEWGEPDTLQDEFVRLTSQLPNVKWHNIDMDNRSINASLKGPWGVSGDPIHIKVKVDIPKKYPNSKAPKFFIDKSSFMTDETRTKIENELYQLVAQFAQHKKNSLGPAFGYLLGEIDLAGSTSFLIDLGDVDDVDDDDEENDDLDVAARTAVADDESSSDSESDIAPGGSAAMSQELPEPTAGTDAPSALSGGFRQTVIPVKRTCGARFSNDGKLACFFPTKEEKAKALFLVNTDNVKERAKGEPRFAGFGRLVQDSQSPQGRRDANDSASEDGSGGSDEDDASSSSSSDSELASMNRISLWYRSGRSRFRKSWSANESVRSSGGGTGTGTGTHAGTTRSSKRAATVKAKNIVSICDMRHLIPSKQVYAREYAIFGDGQEVCEHNAQVAERHGDQDLMHIWRYAGLLLRSDIPLRLAEQQQLVPSKHSKSFLVIARDAVSRFGDEPPPSEMERFLGKVRWGQHPLAHEFISDVFAHFEKLADTQMLAMLACVFGDSWTEDSLAYAESHLTQPQTPLPMKAPSFSLEYFPTNPELWHHQQLQSNWQHQHHHLRSQASSAITTPRTSQTPNLYSYSTSLGSEPGAWLGDPGSYSCGETPPATVGIRAPRGQHHSAGEVDHTQSLSTSPNTRNTGFRRIHSANTGSSSLAASLPRTLQNVMSSSPPDGPSIRKRVSPAETIMNNLAPAVTWGASTVFGAAARHADAAAVAAELRAAAAAASVAGTQTPSTDGIDAQQNSHVESMVAVSVSVKLFNEGCFDDDGWMTTPFLRPERGALYASYRHAYAQMLQVWGLPLARLEIMKFNILKGGDHNSGSGLEFGQQGEDEEDGGHKGPHNSPLTKDAGTAAKDEYGDEIIGGTSSPNLNVSKRRHLKALMESGRGLDVTGVCRIHETKLEPLQSSGRPLPSHYGSELVSVDGTTAEMTIGGAVGTCERCQHSLQSQLRCVYCAEPVAALYPACLGCGCPSHERCLAEWHAAGERLCPAGDECDCGAEADNGKIESWAAMQAAMQAAMSLDRKKQTQAAAAGAGARVRKEARFMGGSSATLHMPRGGGIVTPPIASPSAARPRRQSMPGGIGLNEQPQPQPHQHQHHRPGHARRRSRGGEVGDWDDGMDGEEWESVLVPTGGGGGGSSTSGGNTTPTASRLPSAAAHLNRLRKQVGEMTGRPSILRQRSGGVLQKKAPHQ